MLPGLRFRPRWRRVPGLASAAARGEDALLRSLLSAVRPDAMPQVLLRGRKHALPAEAARRLVETLFAAPQEEQPPRSSWESPDALGRGSLAESGSAERASVRARSRLLR